MLVALAVFALCLLPFIPKVGEPFLKMKAVGCESVFCHDFEGRLCSLRERALIQGPQWVQGGSKGSVIFRVEERVFFQDLSLKATVSGKFFIKEVYKIKNGSKTLYRLALELSYRGAQDNKQGQKFSGYIALEQ